MTEEAKRSRAPVSTLRPPQPRLVRTTETEGEPIIPKGPDVDDEALARAEQDIHPGSKPATEVKALPERNRRKRQRPPDAVVYIRGPKPVCDAFDLFKKKGDYPTHWAALEALLLAAGVEVEDFDV